MNGKGRPPKLTDELKKWIIRRNRGLKKKLKAPALQKELRSVIEKQIRDEEVWQGCSDKMIKGEVENRLPGVSAIQQYIKPQDLNKQFTEDNPWHMGTLDDFPLPVVAIPDLLAVQSYGPTPLTIREARWIARLYGVGNILVQAKAIKKKELPAWYWQWAEAYAENEIICALADVPLDTRWLDERMWKGDYPMVAKIMVNGEPIDSEGKKRIVLISKENERFNQRELS